MPQAVCETLQVNREGYQGGMCCCHAVKENRAVTPGSAYSDLLSHQEPAVPEEGGGHEAVR